jgi:hypothetical protein
MIHERHSCKLCGHRVRSCVEFQSRAWICGGCAFKLAEWLCMRGLVRRAESAGVSMRSGDRGGVDRV